MKRDVIIERCREATPAARERLARALSERFGYDREAVVGALTVGRRMRARAGLDEAAAAKVKAELEALGAVVALAAPKPRMGALAEKSDKLQLSTLDGELAPETPPPRLEKAPEPAAPPPPPQPAQSAAKPAPGGGWDPFKPPDQDAEQEIELAIVPARHGKMAAPPVPTDDPEPPPRRVSRERERERVPSREQPTDAAPERPPARPEGSSPGDLLRRAVADPRARFAIGLAIGLAGGFVPAHVYAAHAEDKLDEIRLELTRQPLPQSEIDYDLAMQQFDLTRERMDHVKTRIAAVAGVIWLLAGSLATAIFWRLAPES